MHLDHDSCQVMKIAYMRTLSIASILNMGLKLELKLLKRNVFFLLFLYLICAGYVFGTFGATNDEIRLMAFNQKPYFIAVSLKTCVSTSDEIGIITKDLFLNCTENELHTCPTPTDGSRAVTHLSVENTSIYGNITHKVMKIVYWCSTYFLSVLIIGLNITCT